MRTAGGPPSFVPVGQLARRGPSALNHRPSVFNADGVNRSSASRVVIGLFVVSVVINAVLGIWALLASDFGETQGKILGTSFLISAAMLSVLVNTPAIRRHALWPAPAVGAVTGASGFVLFIALLWSEADADEWFKLAGSLLVIAAAATLAASLALLSVRPAFRWLPLMEYVSVAVLAATVIYGLWAEPDSAWYARLIGVEGVLVAAFTLLIPVLSRFAPPRVEPAEPESEPPATVAVRFCPSCGRPVTQAPLGADVETVCPACGLAFTVVAGSSRSRAGDKPGPLASVAPETGTVGSGRR